MSTIGGVHFCSPPAIHGRRDEIGSLWTCGVCGRRFVREEFYSEDSRWLGASFDLSPDSEPFEPFVPQIKMGRGCRRGVMRYPDPRSDVSDNPQATGHLEPPGAEPSDTVRTMRRRAERPRGQPIPRRGVRAAFVRNTDTSSSSAARCLGRNPYPKDRQAVGGKTSPRFICSSAA